MKNGKNWYALYVNVRHEKKIGLKMAEKGLENYVPLARRMQQWSDRKKEVEFPLISGYVFAYLSADEMDKPRYVPGVVDYVRFSGKPALVRPEEIDGLKYFIEHGFSFEEYRGEDLKIGDRVEFRLSQFRNFMAIVEQLSGDQFAVVTFEGVTKNFQLKAPVKAFKKKTGKPNV